MEVPQTAKVEMSNNSLITYSVNPDSYNIDISRCVPSYNSSMATMGVTNKVLIELKLCISGVN